MNGRYQLRDIYHTEHIDTSFDNVDINTRNELQQLADEEGLAINWSAWDRVLQESWNAEEIPTNEVCVYNLNGEFLKTYGTIEECADDYGISKEQVRIYLRNHKPYHKQGVVFVKHRLSEGYRDRPIWVYNKNHKLINVFQNTPEAAEHIGTSNNNIHRYAANKQLMPNKQLYIKYKPNE